VGDQQLAGLLRLDPAVAVQLLADLEQVVGVGVERLLALAGALDQRAGDGVAVRQLQLRGLQRRAEQCDRGQQSTQGRMRSGNWASSDIRRSPTS
jgi:hypothetical protein